MRWLKNLFGKKKIEVAPTEQLNIPAVICGAEDEPVITFGERGEDGFAPVYNNGKQTCRVYLWTEGQINEIERIKDELRKEGRI
jgi:hypothetical protein